jgi:transcriptional regulator with XRE-family HTH domain
MRATQSRHPFPPPADAVIGPLLRHWRTTRRQSQLALALSAQISTRHLSYLETGRAQPSRDMVLRLAEALEVPLRERNALLLAAGYAPRYFEAGLAAPEMAQVREAVELILRRQEPYPAYVLDRRWDVLLSNRAAQRLLGFFLSAKPAESKTEAIEANMLRLVLHPHGLRPAMANWEEVAEDLVRHLHNQIAAAPADEQAQALLAEVLAYPGVPARWQARDIGAPTTPLLTTIFRKGELELRLFSTFTTFGTPYDVMLEELRIESVFPADAATASACRELFSA